MFYFLCILFYYTAKFSIMINEAFLQYLQKQLDLLTQINHDH